MIYKFYQIISFLIYPLTKILLLIRVTKGKEDPIRYKEKLGFTSITRPKGKLIWFHAASIGEFNAILPIIRSLSDKNILVTTVTLTAAKVAKNNLPKNAIHQFMPLDSVIIARRFLSHWQPNLVIWTESEFWPNMLMLCNAKMLLINARLSQQSFAKWNMAKKFAKSLINKFSLIIAQSMETKTYLEKLGAKEVCYFGNLKFIAANFTFNQDELEKLKLQLENRVIIMAASTHKGEEEMFSNIHRKLKVKYPQLLTIIAPRHPDRKQEVLETFTSLEVVTRSSKSKISKNTDILLVDTLGEFGLFYRLSEVVCIGGSWKKIAHNFIEAAKLRNLIIFGPNMNNSREVADDFLEKEGALFALDENAIAKIIDLYIQNPQAFDIFKDNAENIVDKMSQVKDKILKKMSPFMDKL